MSRTWARGITTSYGYDSLGQLSSVSYSDGGTTPPVTFAYDRRGRLKQSSVSGGTSTSLVYNDLGEVLVETNSGGLLDGLSVLNAYDALLRRTNVTAKGSSVLSTAGYSYDAASRLLSVSDGIDSATYSYLTNSSLVGNITFKSNSFTAMTTTKQYDYLNRLLSVSNAPASAPADSHGYSYNSAHQRTQVVNADGSYWSYAYDSLGQVTNGVKHWRDNTLGIRLTRLEAALPQVQVGIRMEVTCARLVTPTTC